jgi:catechol 2,3-dioxygenase-like lactoylglutathione lyase family enzyme
MPDAELKLGAIGQIAVQADDIDASVAFYRDALGLPFIAQFPPGLAFFDCDGTRLMISAVEEGDAGTSTLYFNVPDIQAAYKALETRGVELEGEPHVVHSSGDYELWMAFFRDPSGNLMAIMDERGTLIG